MTMDSSNIAQEHGRSLRVLVEALKAAGYDVVDASMHKSRVFDLLASREHLGRKRQYWIRLRHHQHVGDKTIRYFLASAEAHIGDEFWFVAGAFSLHAMHLAGALPNIRLFKLSELLTQLSVKSTPKSGVSRSNSRPKVLRALQTNKKQLVLMTAALSQLLNDRIESLKDQKPNDPDAISARDAQVSDYEVLKAKVSELQKAIVNFKATRASQEQAEKRAGAFRTGIETWWKKSANSICNSTYGIGLFVLGTGICSLMGMDIGQAGYLSAALAGGNSVAGAVKSMTKQGIGH